MTPAGRRLEILVDGVHKAFGTNRVLRGVDLEIERGTMVALIGGSGCGKTVLLQHMIGHLTPDRGRVLVADHESEGAPLMDLATLDEQGLDRIRIHSAVVFQRNALFSGTVQDNVALWLREIRRLPEPEIARRVQEAVASVGLGGEPGILARHRDELSGGMAKRVAVARALAMRPTVMYYDEPTTGLDPANASQIHELIAATHRRLGGASRGATTVVVTHDKDLLRRLEPRIVMLDAGRVYFDGSYDEFEQSEAPIIRPYFDLMPVLHSRSLGV